MATLLERLVFLQKMPTLMRATADDESPCPGYLFEEISKISHESLGCCQCLLEYLLERLQVESCHVKLKVLKILLHLCSHGPPHFLTELRRNATFIQEVIVYSGPLDPVHGNAPFQKVRSSAQELASLLFNDTMSPDSASCKTMTTSMGMGSESHRSGMQGFGYSPGKSASNGATLLDKIQRAAEVVASAVLPPAEHPGIRLHDNHYHAVVAPSAAVEMAVPACAYNIQSHSHRASHRCPGQAGGGWEETDSGHSSSHNSSQDILPVCQTSVGRSSKSGGSGSHSGASRESGDLSERVEAMQLGDCGQEMTLINGLTSGSKVFLSREESQHFIKECSTLNCEVVVELLSRKLQDPTHTVQMRAMCALACLMSSDFLSLEHIFNITHKRLAQLSERTEGPVANKATKLLRQFEALLGRVTHPGCDHAERPASSSSSLSQQLPKSLTFLPRQLEDTATSSEKPPSTDRTQVNMTTPESLIKGKEEEKNSSKLPEPSRLSLFSGMELVNRSKPVCLVEPVPVEATADTDCVIEKSCERTIGSPASSKSEQCKEQASAFSFLNL